MSASAPWGKRQLALLAALALETILLLALVPDARSPAILLDQSRYWMEMAVCAPWMLLVVTAGGIDLSIGSILALCGVTIVRLHAEGGLPIALAAGLGLLLGTAAGSVNGILIALTEIPPLVVTIATLAIHRGLAHAVAANRVHSNLPEGYRYLGDGLLCGFLPAQWAVAILAWGAAFILLHRTRTGRHLFAIGASPRAARLARVPARGTIVALYALSGLGAAVAAVLYTARANAAKGDDALGLELETITAVCLSGASLSGGRGSLPGLVLGVLILGALRTGLLLAGVPELYQKLATGVVLIVTAAINERVGGGQVRAG